ncbi:sensor histidine kinase regulating citrate/malate metabolism [Methanofollis sp. W23]|uniref:PAS domain-containing protein n=1 Tax=Methanofollis sp. W23 TaxID=2817849 RepID=UPI001AE56E8F|nr:PAS domain-containing protein [Methanofollis sp. W23]MBP2145871.1 sensor histidine kinase regulating citrate/malate metabolism [Methanofollis sp. W23]
MEKSIIDDSCILESLPTPVVALSRTGDLTVFNRAAADLFKVDQDNAVGQSAEAVIPAACAYILRKIARRSAEFCVVSRATLTHAGRDHAVLAAPHVRDGSVIGAVIVIGPSAPSAPARDLAPVRAVNGGGYWVPIFVPSSTTPSGTPFDSW